MRIFPALLILPFGLLTLIGCAEMHAVDINPKTGALLIDSTDTLYVKGLLADTAKQYDLGPQQLASADMIASYEGGQKGTFSSGVAFIILWQYTNPNHLRIDINGPAPIAASPLSKRIFREVKAKLIAHFGADRVRDVSKTVVSLTGA
jgi:hypothetical protein